MDQLGELFRLEADFARAEPLLRDALAARRASLGPDDPAVIQSLGHLGRLFEDEGQFARAEEPYREALAASERRFGAGSPESAGLPGRLRARNQSDLGRESKAIESPATGARRSARGRSARRRSASPLPSRASDFTSTAAGEYPESAAALERALAIRQKVARARASARRCDPARSRRRLRRRVPPRRRREDRRERARGPSGRAARGSSEGRRGAQHARDHPHLAPRLCRSGAGFPRAVRPIPAGLGKGSSRHAFGREQPRDHAAPRRPGIRGGIAGARGPGGAARGQRSATGALARENLAATLEQEGRPREALEARAAGPGDSAEARRRGLRATSPWPCVRWRSPRSCAARRDLAEQDFRAGLRLGEGLTPSRGNATYNGGFRWPISSSARAAAPRPSRCSPARSPRSTEPAVPWTRSGASRHGCCKLTAQGPPAHEPTPPERSARPCAPCRPWRSISIPRRGPCSPPVGRPAPPARESPPRSGRRHPGNDPCLQAFPFLPIEGIDRQECSSETQAVPVANGRRLGKEMRRGRAGEMSEMRSPDLRE